MKKLFIPIVLGTAREGRHSEKVAKFIFEEVSKSAEIETEILDVRDYLLDATVATWQHSPRTKPWQDKMNAMDALIIVMPEYNHGYPGELKMVFDQALHEYEHKPVILAGVSVGDFAGVRVVENFLPVITKVGMVFCTALYYPRVPEIFHNNGEIQQREKLEKRVQDAFEKLMKYTRALEVLRK